MKAIAFNGSPRKEGNTSTLLDKVLGELENEGIETEKYQLGGEKVSGCTACMQCHKNKDKACVIRDDVINECIEKMLEADAVILGSPTYFANVNTEIKALIDRAGFVSKGNNDMLKNKLGAAVVAVRRAGSNHVFNSLNHFFLINQMIVPGSLYWNCGVGLGEKDVENDEEGMQTMKILGENMAWLLKKINN